MIKALTVMVEAFLLDNKNLGDYKLEIWAIGNKKSFLLKLKNGVHLK